MPIDRELLELLGVAESAVKTQDSTEAVPAAQASGGLAALLAVFELWAPFRGAEVPILRLDRYLAVPKEAPVEVLAAGVTAEGPDLLGFDTKARVVLRMPGTDGRTWVIDAREGTVERHVVSEVADAPDAPVVELSAPDIAGWAAQAHAEPWLAETSARLAASPSAVDRLAGAGLFARLWTAPEGANASSPRELARAWARGQDAASLNAAESAAVRRAWHLSDRLSQVGTLPESLAVAEMAAIVRDRDDLQSVRRVLRLAGAGGRLGEALASVDRVAGEHLSSLTGLLPDLSSDPDAERWHAVGWQEPDAWWAAAD